MFWAAEQLEKFNLGTVFHKQKIWFEYKILFNKSGEKGATSARMQCNSDGCQKYHLHLPCILWPLEMKAESVP